MDREPLQPVTSSVPEPASGRGRLRGQRFASVLFAAVAVAAGVWTLRTFLPAITWAGVLAIASWPLYSRLKSRSPAPLRKGALAALCTLAIGLLVIVPVVLVGIELGRDVRYLLQHPDDLSPANLVSADWLARLPLVGPQIGAWWREHAVVSDEGLPILRDLNRADLLVFGRDLGAQLLRRATTFVLTLVVLFFIFRDGEAIAAALLRASARVFGPRGARVARQIAASVHGTVDGLVLVGLGEGLALGIAYHFAKVPHATLLGAITAGAAIIPFGAFTVFSIASAILLVRGAIFAAIAVFAFGLAVLAVADNVVRPLVIGNATTLPFVWVLLGILGGVETFGLLGLFLGPAIMAVLILLWREWTAPAEAAEGH
jgi:predicted PurR-regulated permease PerM